MDKRVATREKESAKVLAAENTLASAVMGKGKQGKQGKDE